jgi:hypothetical protein
LDKRGIAGSIFFNERGREYSVGYKERVSFLIKFYADFVVYDSFGELSLKWIRFVL